MGVAAPTLPVQRELEGFCVCIGRVDALKELEGRAYKYSSIHGYFEVSVLYWLAQPSPLSCTK